MMMMNLVLFPNAVATLTLLLTYMIITLDWDDFRVQCGNMTERVLEIGGLPCTPLPNYEWRSTPSNTSWGKLTNAGHSWLFATYVRQFHYHSCHSFRLVTIDVSVEWSLHLITKSCGWLASSLMWLRWMHVCTSNDPDSEKSRQFDLSVSNLSL